MLLEFYDIYNIIKFKKHFLNSTTELIVKYSIGLKTLLQKGISEPVFYGDLVYKFKRIVESLILGFNLKYYETLLKSGIQHVDTRCSSLPFLWCIYCAVYSFCKSVY